jgi:hypothetical protein
MRPTALGPSTLGERRDGRGKKFQCNLKTRRDGNAASDAEKASGRAGRNRRYRGRRRRGQFCVSVQIDGRILDFLERARWLSERDSHDVGKIGEAIRGLLELSSKI